MALPIKDLIKPSQELVNSIPKNAILTDVGSVKEPIVKIWEKTHPLFIGSHPMAGTERKGVNSGYENLFDNAKWIITPTLKSNKESLNKLSKLISSMGCDICTTTPIIHDQSVALISHLPIYIASCLIKTASSSENRDLLKLSHQIASSGFKDTSRVGGGNSSLGLDLAINNRQNILNSLQSFKENICEIENNIKNEEWEILIEKLDDSKNCRNYFCN